MFEFYKEGGWGMHLVSIFGFLMIVVAVLHTTRPDPRLERALWALGVATFGAGVLGTLTGISATVRYIDQVEDPKKFITFCYGLEESIHNLILTSILITIASLIAFGGAIRGKAPATA